MKRFYPTRWHILYVQIVRKDTVICNMTNSDGTSKHIIANRLQQKVSKYTAACDVILEIIPCYSVKQCLNSQPAMISI